MKQRPIKFRAYSHKHKKIFEVDSIQFMDDIQKPGYIVFRREDNVQEWMDKDSLDLLQYTGRRDKNGNDIYEGHIVKRNKKVYDWEKNATNDLEAYSIEEQISFIEYRDNGFWISAEDFGWEGEDLWDWEEIEIIGDIFTTPEFLPKKIEDTAVNKLSQ